MAGLLAANMLRRFKPEVMEAQSSLPHNHGALLRFRTDAVSRATGIPFKKVTVHKAVSCGGRLTHEASLLLNNMYSLKVTGRVVNRSIFNLASGDRWIAPDNFIEQMFRSVNISFNYTLTDVTTRDEDSEPMISTIPMPVMMKLANWSSIPKFEARPVWSVTANLADCEVYQTVYFPGKEPYYRASVTGSRLIVEYLSEPKSPDADIAEVTATMGINVFWSDIKVKEQEYGKLVPLADPLEARRFIVFLSDHYRIYSLGRFATWRTLLLDDVVKDVGVIERIIESRDGYHKKLEAWR